MRESDVASGDDDVSPRPRGRRRRPGARRVSRRRLGDVRSRASREDRLRQRPAVDRGRGAQCRRHRLEDLCRRLAYRACPFRSQPSRKGRQSITASRTGRLTIADRLRGRVRHVDMRSGSWICARATDPDSFLRPRGWTGPPGRPTARRSPTGRRRALGEGRRTGNGTRQGHRQRIGTTEERPVWSPDGNTLYYDRGRPPVPPGTRDLYKISPVAAGSLENADDARRTDDWQPALSPDGKTPLLPAWPDEQCSRRFGSSASTGAWSRPSPRPAAGASTASGPRTEVGHPLHAGGVRSGRPRPAGSSAETPGVPTSWKAPNTSTATPTGRRTSRRNAIRRVAHIGVNQFATITLSCTDPDFGFGAEPPTPTPLESDALEIAMGPSHGTIGGISNERSSTRPNKDFQGIDAFTYTGTDGTSNAIPASVTIQVGNPPAGDHTPPSISGDQALGEEMAARQRPGEDLESADRDDDLVHPQRGGARDPHVPERQARQEVRREVREADQRQQEPPEMHPLRQCGKHQLQRQCRRQQGASSRV